MRRLKASKEWHEKLPTGQTRRSRALLLQYQFIREVQHCDNSALKERLQSKYISPYKQSRQSLQPHLAIPDLMERLLEFAVCSTKEYELALNMLKVL